MPALPPNNTAVWRISYSNVYGQHQFDVRDADPAQGDTLGLVADFLTALGDRVIASTVTGVTLQEAGAQVSMPQQTTLDGMTFGANNGTPEDDASFVSFTGRSIGGRRTRITIFGFANDQYGNNFRFTPGEDGAPAAALAVLQNAAGGFIAIDGQPVVWNNYVNAGVNAYWQRRKRRG